MAEKNWEDNYIIVDRRDGKKGKTIATYNITPNSAIDKWETIRQIIDDYAKTHPIEVKEILDAARERRLMGNEYGSSEGILKKRGFRRGMMLPMGLQLILKKNFPEIFKDKKQYTKFMKKFPGFNTINKV